MNETKQQQCDQPEQELGWRTYQDFLATVRLLGEMAESMGYDMSPNHLDTFHVEVDDRWTVAYNGTPYERELHPKQDLYKCVPRRSWAVWYDYHLAAVLQPDTGLFHTFEGCTPVLLEAAVRKRMALDAEWLAKHPQLRKAKTAKRKW